MALNRCPGCGGPPCSLCKMGLCATCERSRSLRHPIRVIAKAGTYDDRIPPPRYDGPRLPPTPIAGIELPKRVER